MSTGTLVGWRKNVAIFRCMEGHQGIAHGLSDDRFDGGSLCRTEGLLCRRNRFFWVVLPEHIFNQTG